MTPSNLVTGFWLLVSGYWFLVTLYNMLYKQPYKKTAFQVRKPIRSFRDLEVYQRAAGAATEVMVKVMSLLAEGSSLVKERYILLRRKTFNLYKKAWMRFSGKQEPVSEHGYSQGLG